VTSDLPALSVAALRRLGLILVVASLPVATVTVCGSASAQDTDLRTLVERVERLQREVTDLQRTVYSGAPPAPGSVAPSDGSAAQHLLRLEQLETQLRQLTGQVEELTYRQTQLDQKLDRINADTDLRLRQLEGTAPPAAGGAATGAADTGGAPVAGAAAAPPATSATVGAAGAGTVTSGTAAGSVPPAAPATGSQTLGTISDADLATQRGQGPDRTTAAAAAAAVAAGQTGSAASPVEAEYQQAFGLLRQQNYAGAEEALRAFVSQHPDDPLAGNAQYWLGETYYVRKDYRQAAVTFAEGYQRYPKSAKAPDNLLKLGLSLAQIGEKIDACAAFAQLAKQFPDAPASLKDRASRERQRIACG